MLRLKNLKNFPKIKLGEFVPTFFFLTRIIAIVFSFPCITDIGNYLSHFTHNQIDHLAAYRQFNFEYPPLALLAINIPGWTVINKIDETSYYFAFALMMLLVDFCCLKTCQIYCKNRLKMAEDDIAYMGLLYSLFGLLLFKLIYHRLDLVVALFFTLSLVFFQARDPKLKPQFFLNAVLGFFYKFVPAITMPTAIIFKARSLKEIILNSLIFLCALASIIFALEIYTEHNFIKNMLFHQARGIHIESSYGSFLLFKNMLLNQTSPIFNTFGSWNIISNPYFENFTKIFGNLILLSFYAALFLKKIKPSEEKFLDTTLITILLFCAFQRVLSPQFFIWLIPIAAIWLAKNRSIKFLISFSFLFLATAVIFSTVYLSLVNEEPIIVTCLFLRNLALLGLTLFLTMRFFKKC